MPSGNTGILDWYTILIGVSALAVLALHGAAWIAYKTEGALNERACAMGIALWWFVAALTVIVTLTSFVSCLSTCTSFRLHPWGFVFPDTGHCRTPRNQMVLRARQEGTAFCASCAYIVGMLTSVAFSLYPNVLPASTNPIFGLTIANSKAADYGLKIGLIWWVIGMAL